MENITEKDKLFVYGDYDFFGNMPHLPKLPFGGKIYMPLDGKLVAVKPILACSVGMQEVILLLDAASAE